jgi:hypothetical protein
MVTEELRGLISSRTLLEFIKDSSSVMFEYAALSYEVEKIKRGYKAIFSIDDIDADERIDMTVLHEMGHFLQVPIERILKKNYGINSNGNGGYSIKALENEMEAIAISLSLANYFGVQPTSYIGIINVLGSLKKYVDADQEAKAKILGRVFIRSLEIDNSALLRKFHFREEFLDRHD